MCKRKKEEVIIRPLSKKTDLGKNNSYVKRLLKSTENKNIHNIGVFGTYGSGKSSVVGSFINESKKKAIYFSQDTFNKHIHSNDEESIIDIREAIYKELLSYNTASVKFKNYLKCLFRKFSDIVFTIIWLLLFASVASFVGIYLYEKIKWCCIPAGIACFLAELLIYFLFTQNRIKELNVKVGQAISFLVDPEEDITDAIADHPAAIENIIIKILKTNSIKFIVIEDIERLETTQSVKDYLKEFKVLNDLINRSKEYANDPIVFIYGLKDWCIGDSEARTKYFDYIVPILPYASFSNAEDSLISDPVIIRDGISKDLIFDISVYFSNQRQINALITEYEISKEETDFDNLKNEQFTLAALNVLYPQIYCLLSHKNNFLDYALKTNVASSTFAKDLKQRINDQFKFLEEEENLEDYEKINTDDVVLFIKMAILNKYLTYNYEKLMYKSFKHAMVSTDRETLKKIRGFVRIDDCDIIEPSNFLSRLHDKEYLIYSDPMYLNVDLTKSIVSSNDQNRKQSIAGLITKLEVKELTGFLNKYIEKYPLDSDIDELIKLISFEKNVYLAGSKTKKPHQVCHSCLKNALIPILTSNKVELKPFFAIVNSKEFAQSYAHQISIEKYNELFQTNAIHFEDISSFHDNHEYLEVFKNNNMYKGSFQNLSIIHEGFSCCPIHTIETNSYVKAQVQLSGVTHIKELLNMCDLLETKDTDKEVIKFLNTFEEDDIKTILESEYFNQWELKIPNSLFNASLKQSLEILKRGLFNVTENAFVFNNMKAYPKAFAECFNNASDKLNKLMFVWQDSNEIAINMESDVVCKISNSLDLTSINNVVSSKTEAEKVIKLTKLLGDKEKKEFLQNVANNYSALLVEAAKNKTIAADDLNEVSLDKSILDSFINDCEDEYVDLFTLSQNETVAINAIQQPGATTDYSRLFVDKEGNVKKHKNIDLIVAYCSSTNNRNFDKVAEIIDSLKKEDFVDKKKWKTFILSFSTPDSRGNLLYFENNANNERVLDKLSACNLLTEKNLIRHDTVYKCKLVN